MATDSSIVIPFLEKSWSIPSSPISAGGSEASANPEFGGLDESLRPKGTSIVGPPDKATASRAAMIRMSAHETCWGQTASTVDLIRLIEFLFRIPKFFEDAISEDLILMPS